MSAGPELSTSFFGAGLALEDAVEGAAVDAEQLGGAHLVAAGLVEHERDVPALELLQRHPVRRQLGRVLGLGVDVRRQVFGGSRLERASATARSIACSSSRTLPGHP